MKKIFTFIAAALFTSSIFAADHRPEVTLKSNRNYEVIVDGKSYITNNSTITLAGVRSGQHSVKVYEANSSPFRKFKKLVYASSFQVRNNDIAIRVDNRGQVTITEDKGGRDWDKDRRKDEHGFGQGGRDNSYGRDEKNKRF